MSDPFEFEEEEFEEEFDIEDEWVEISDIDGRKVALRHLATVRVDDQIYFVLGAVREGGSCEKALMLIREDKTVDGEKQYVIAGDEQEIERVVAHFAMHVLEAHMEIDADSFIGEEAMEPCGCMHTPVEFCYCDDPAYLQ